VRSTTFSVFSWPLFLLVDGLALAVHQSRAPGEDYNVHASFISAFAAFALGAQNLLSQKSSLIKANTTFMTGNIQKMAEAVWNELTKKGGLKPAEKRAAILLFCTWLPYVIGGIFGAALAHELDWSLSPIAAFYGLGMLSMQFADMPKVKAKRAAVQQDSSAHKRAAGTETSATTPAPPLIDTDTGCQAGEDVAGEDVADLETGQREPTAVLEDGHKEKFAIDAPAPG